MRSYLPEEKSSSVWTSCIFDSKVCHSLLLPPQAARPSWEWTSTALGVVGLALQCAARLVLLVVTFVVRVCFSSYRRRHRREKETVTGSRRVLFRSLAVERRFGMS